MAKKKIESFLGEMYRDVDVTNAVQMGYYIEAHIERHKKQPDIILVDPAIDVKSVVIPDKYRDSVTVVAKQYCQKGHIHVAHIIEVDKEI